MVALDQAGKPDFGAMQRANAERLYFCAFDTWRSAVKTKCACRSRPVAQVELTEWTSATHLQHSQFLDLRDGKDPRDVSQRRWISIAIMRCCHPG
jgi:ATP-dependent DNA ligase